MSPTTVTGALTLCTLDSSLIRLRARSHSCSTSFSGRNLCSSSVATMES